MIMLVAENIPWNKIMVSKNKETMIEKSTNRSFCFVGVSFLGTAFVFCFAIVFLTFIFHIFLDAIKIKHAPKPGYSLANDLEEIEPEPVKFTKLDVNLSILKP